MIVFVCVHGGSRRWKPRNQLERGWCLSTGSGRFFAVVA